MQQAVNTTQPEVLNFINSVVQEASRFPGELEKLGLHGLAGDINDELIGYARNIQESKNRTAGIVEENLRRQKIRSTGSNVAEWLAEPGNLVLAILGLIALIIGVRSL